MPRVTLFRRKRIVKTAVICYNIRDMTFGSGTPLWQHSPSLRNPKERAARIVDAVERNSVIEGLPKFNKPLRNSMLKKLEASA